MSSILLLPRQWRFVGMLELERDPATHEPHAVHGVHQRFCLSLEDVAAQEIDHQSLLHQ
jgi:hypothetical protein